MKDLAVCVGALLAVALVAVATAAAAQDTPDAQRQECADCPQPRPKYDSTEIVKRTRDIDQSRVVETQSVEPSRRVVETNHLVIYENETRNVGTVQHNHTIIERELVLTKRNVDTQTINTEVDLVQHRYNTVRKRVVEYREIPGEHRDITCNCGPRHRRGGLVPIYGRAHPARTYALAPGYVTSRYRY